MDIVGSIQEAREKVFSDVKRLLGDLRSLLDDEPESVSEGIARIAEIRDCAYEDLNQIQHEYLILEAAIWLIENAKVPESVTWYWNPRQTGGSNEPDLRAEIGGATRVSCEITTSRRPVGTIAERMKNTLSKLSRFEGNKFYFVRTDKMLRRAQKYINDGGWPIEAVRIEI